MNNRMIVIILTAFFLFVFSSCSTSNNDNQQNRKVFRSILNNNPNDSLIVIQNISENYMMVLTKHSDDVISICGGGNIDFCYTNNDSIIIDEYGWKQIAGDVFRSPRHQKILSAFIGTGFEVLCLIIVSLILTLIGFIKPEIRLKLINYMGI